MRLFVTAFLALAALASAAAGQTAAGSDSESPALRYFYADYAKKNLLASAGQMPEAGYAFRPTAGTRTFAELLGHVADGQYLFCSSARGEPNPRPAIEAPGRSSAAAIEKAATTKAEVTAALRESFAYCDDVFARLKDADLSRATRLLGQHQSVAMVTNLAIVHLVEHYGQVTVYLRLNGLVPPSSQGKEVGQ